MEPWSMSLGCFEGVPMDELHTVGCVCGRLLPLPIGVGSYNGNQVGDTFAIASLLTSARWSHVVRAGTWYARCGQCDTRWPWDGGGNAHDRRILRRAFRPIKARQALGATHV